MTVGGEAMKRLLATAVLPLALVLACGKGSSSAPTVASFCQQKAGAECQPALIGACASGTTDECVTAREAACMQFAEAALSDPNRVLNQNNIGNCISKTKAAFSTGATIPFSTLTSIDLACNYVFQGSAKQLSDPCTSQYDCAGKTDGSIICDKGFCATASTVAAGHACGDPGEICAANYYCAKNSSDLYTCVASATSGQPCSASVPCAQDLRCANGTCTTLVDVGGACAADSDCAASAPYCDPYVQGEGVCEVGLSFAPGSTSCAAFTSASAGSGGAGGGAGAGSGTGGAGGGSPGSGGAPAAAGGTSGGGAAGSGGTLDAGDSSGLGGAI
jgi:Dickkopf-like protein